MLGLVAGLMVSSAFTDQPTSENSSAVLYTSEVSQLRATWKTLMLETKRLSEPSLIPKIHEVRGVLKRCDFWFRYFDPLAYRQMNAPLPVEYETEVFEKFEPPYKRSGAGLTLLENYLLEGGSDPDSAMQLLIPADSALQLLESDSVMRLFQHPQHFYFANRLFLMNLASIYTTGFDGADTSRVLPELNDMLLAVKGIYQTFDNEHPNFALTADYLEKYESMLRFVKERQTSFEAFDHFTFLRDFVNPLFLIHQHRIRYFGFVSSSLVDYSINDAAVSLFSKDLIIAQDARGIFSKVHDAEALHEISEVGKLLFFDPVLSGNGKRSCASCHHPGMYFTDTTQAAPLAFNGRDHLTRNPPSLMNVFHNHLLMQDGKFYLTEHQIRDVIYHPSEMACTPGNLLPALLQSKEYSKRFARLTHLTPAYPQLNERHVYSALMVYLAQFSQQVSPFDDAMNFNGSVSLAVQSGFNIFMGKAKCGTCHFVPYFNGMKPPYVGSEFEVIGVPADTTYSAISSDLGRSVVFQAPEMLHAFRTGTVRNAAKTPPYMHNGVFRDLNELIQFYNHGGGVGHGLDVPNQTLPADSLHLSDWEMQSLTLFIESLTEEFSEQPPVALPEMRDAVYRSRRVGGNY